jgi:hypothetical protein
MVGSQRQQQQSAGRVVGDHRGVAHLKLVEAVK